MILEVNDDGEVILPAELVQAVPHTQLEVGRQGETLVLKPLSREPKPKMPISSLPTIPGRFVDETTTFRREDIYETDAR